MVYPFKCDKCGAERDEVMRAMDYNDNQPCHICGERMRRVFSSIRVSVPARDGWNAGLGCSERNAKDKIRELRDKGIDIEETGNEKIKSKTVNNDYELSKSDIAELNRIVDNAAA